MDMNKLKEKFRGLTGKAKILLHSSDILDGENVAVIQHGEEFYRLQVTRQNKLILTK